MKQLTLENINKNYLKFESLDYNKLQGPIHVTDETLLENNLEILSQIYKKTKTKVLIALKAFSQYSMFEKIALSLQGATASSLFEANLANNELKKYNKNLEIHAYTPAFVPEDVNEFFDILDHVVFNSISQYEKYINILKKDFKKVSVGLRINPEHSEVKTDLYNPCSNFSRLGVRLNDFVKHDNLKIDGLHFHNLCELNSDSLERTWKIVDKNFGEYLKKLKWLNIGGGHLITNYNYDLPRLYNVIEDIKNKYPNLEIFIEPGEAVVLNCGVLVAEVLDIISSKKNNYPIAILNISASAHLPDVLEMPYRPNIFTNGIFAEVPEKNSENKFVYKLGGLTCLSGDVIGDYAFREPLEINQKLFFTDMSHYTMVKSSNFNGIRSPSIAISNIEEKSIKLIKKFTYEDYKSRL